MKFNDIGARLRPQMIFHLKAVHRFPDIAVFKKLPFGSIAVKFQEPNFADSFDRLPKGLAINVFPE